MSKLTDYCQFEHTWAVFEITGLDNQIERILSVLEIPFSREEVEKKFEEAWEEAERKFVEESEDEFVDFVISHPEDKNIFLLYHIDVRVHDYDYVIIRGKKEKKKEIQKVFVKEWMRTSGSGQYPEGFDIDRYFSDKIETKHTKIDAIIIDQNLDLQWFGINEDKED